MHWPFEEPAPTTPHAYAACVVLVGPRPTCTTAPRAARRVPPDKTSSSRVGGLPTAMEHSPAPRRIPLSCLAAVWPKYIFVSVSALDFTHWHVEHTVRRVQRSAPASSRRAAPKRTCTPAHGLVHLALDTDAWARCGSARRRGEELPVSVSLDLTRLKIAVGRAHTASDGLADTTAHSSHRGACALRVSTQSGEKTFGHISSISLHLGLYMA